MLCRSSQLSVIPPLTTSLVPIPDDVVETSDDEDDNYAADHTAAALPLICHQPRPFAVRCHTASIVS